MAGTHGDLFREIGSMVVAAHSGQAIDLDQESEDLARRYDNLGMPADMIARAIARSIGAVGISMAIIHPVPRAEAVPEESAPLAGAEMILDDDGSDWEGAPRSPAALFPSGVRLAVLS
jgi:hypothetical protein